MNTGTQSTQPEATRVTDPTGNVRSVLHLPNAKHQTNSIRQSQQIHLPRLWTNTKPKPIYKDQATTTEHRINTQTTITSQTSTHTVNHRFTKGANAKPFTTIHIRSTPKSQQTRGTHHTTLDHTTKDQANTTNTTKSSSKDNRLTTRLGKQTTKKRPRTYQKTTVEHPRQGKQNTINNKKRHNTSEHIRTNSGEVNKATHKSFKTKENRTIEQSRNIQVSTTTPTRRRTKTGHNRGHILPEHRSTNIEGAKGHREPKRIGTNTRETRGHTPLDQKGGSTQGTNEHPAPEPTRQTTKEHKTVKTRQRKRTKRAQLALIRNNQKMSDMHNRKHFRKLYNANKGDNIVKFFEEFDAWNNRLGRDDDEKTSALMKCLSKTTRQIYQDLAELVPQSYQSIKEDLIASHKRPNITIWKSPPVNETGSLQEDNPNMDKTKTITPPDIKKSVTFKIGPPDYIEEYTNHNNPERTWMDPLGTRNTSNEENTKEHLHNIEWEPSPDKEKDEPTRHQTTDTNTTITTTNTQFDIETRTTPTWHRHDDYDRPIHTTIIPYRPHTPYCTYCFKKGHNDQTCYKLGYTPHHQFGQTIRGHHGQTAFQRKHWDKGHKSEQPTTTPIKGTDDLQTDTTHHHGSTINQSITDRTYMKTKEIISTVTDRLANSQQRKAMMPICILVMAGIGALLGQTITSLAAGSSHIIGALGTGIKNTFHELRNVDGSTWRTITNATMNIITTGTTGISIMADTKGGPNGIILYSLIAILYIYLIYDKVKDNLRPARGLTHHRSNYNNNLGSPLPENECELLDMNTKTLDYNNEIFWPMTQGPRPNTNEIWNPGDKNNPTLV